MKTSAGVLFNLKKLYVLKLMMLQQYWSDAE